MSVKSKKSFSFFSIFIYGAVFLIGLSIGRYFNIVQQKVTKIVPSKNNLSLKNYDFSLYWEVYDQLENRYVDPSKLDPQKMYYGSIKGMVASIGDPATMFLDPEETSDFEKSLGAQYEGVGILLDIVKNTPHVVTAFEGAPAYEAGIRSGDFIIAVDDKEVVGLTLGKVASLIRGEAGTQVKLTILRNGKKIDFTVTRGKISAPSMRFVKHMDNIDIIRISRFTESSYPEWVSKWNELIGKVNVNIKKGETKAIIIDLRDNPGGFFNAAVSMLGDLLPRGSVVAHQADRTGVVHTYKTDKTPSVPGSVPVVVLVNSGTASAAEIVSGALQHYKRAYIVGEKTYGKGTVQEIVPFDKVDGSSLHITIYKWLLPNKKWINHDNPIVPDKEVKFDMEAWNNKQEDTQLNEAIKYLQDKISK